MVISKSFICQACDILLIALWSYAAAAKLLDLTSFHLSIQRQLLGPELREIMNVGLIPTEVAVATLLSIRKTKSLGLVMSALLLVAFTTYIVLILSHAFGKTPCACGGLISRMGWHWHLVFNLLFLAINLIDIIYTKEGRQVT